MRAIILAAVMALAACGDNLETAKPDVDELSSCDELADAVPADDVGECLVTGTGFLVAGVSYRAADGGHTWVQSVQWHGGETRELVEKCRALDVAGQVRRDRRGPGVARLDQAVASRGCTNRPDLVDSRLRSATARV